MEPNPKGHPFPYGTKVSFAMVSGGLEELGVWDFDVEGYIYDIVIPDHLTFEDIEQGKFYEDNGGWYIINTGTPDDPELWEVNPYVVMKKTIPGIDFP